MKLDEFMDKVPWADMRVMPAGWIAGRIRTKSEPGMCPIAAVTGDPYDTGIPHTAGARIGLGAYAVHVIVNAADNFTSSDDERSLRADMLRRMAAR